MARAASLVVALFGLLSLGTAAFALSRLHADVYAAQVLMYIIVPLALAGAAVLVLRASAEVRLGTAMALISAGVAVAASEIGAAALVGLQARASDQTSIRAQMLQMRLEGVDAFPRIPGNLLVDRRARFTIAGAAKHPILPGPARATILLCDEDRPLLTYQSDRYGLDNPDSVWDVSAPQLAIIGDSYTVGVCVPSDDAIPGRLRQRVTLLNVGVSGAGPLQELALLRELVAARRPATVVWIYYEGNDFYDLGREANHEWLRAYLSPGHSQQLEEHRSAMDSAFRVWSDSISDQEPDVRPVPPLWRLGDIIRLKSLRLLVPAAISLPERDPRVRMLAEVLARARADIEEWGGRFVVVYMPAYLRYGVLVGDPFPAREAVLRSIRELDIELVDLHETFLATGNPRGLWVTPRSHLTPDGYGIAARAIESALDLHTADRR